MKPAKSFHHRPESTGMVTRASDTVLRNYKKNSTSFDNPLQGVLTAKRTVKSKGTLKKPVLLKKKNMVDKLSQQIMRSNS